jgi:hypothetical protein
MVVTKGNVHHHQATVNTPHHTLRMIDHLIKRDGYGCFMPGQEERHRFVADLLIVHASAIVLVARVQEEREQVGVFGFRLPAFADDELAAMA